MTNRRKFIKNTATGLVFPTLGLNSAKTKQVFVHHVYFYLKENNSENLAKLKEGLLKLSKVPTIKFFHLGEPASTNRSVIVKDYSISWLCFFDNLEEEEQYQKDPIHLKFVADYSHLWSKVNVYDAVNLK